MNILITITIGLVCFGIGALVGANGIDRLENISSDMEETVDKMEQAVDFIENVNTVNIDETNFTLNQNRDAQASLNIQTLHYLEKGDIESAKEILIHDLASTYIDIKDDAAHDMKSPESENVINRIETLSKEHSSFKQIIDESGWVK